MYEVKITAEFTTGITQEDQKKAEQQSKAILLKLLEAQGITEAEDGIFQVRIVDVQSEDLFPSEKGQMLNLSRQVQLIAARRKGIITMGLPVKGPGGHLYHVIGIGDSDRNDNEAWKMAREFICACESGQTVLEREYILSHLPPDEPAASDES